MGGWESVRAGGGRRTRWIARIFIFRAAHEATPIFCGMDAGRARTEGRASLRWREMQERDERQPREEKTLIHGQARATGEEGEQRRSVRDEQDGGVHLMYERVNEHPGHLREYEREKKERKGKYLPSSRIRIVHSVNPTTLHPLPRLHPRQGTAKQGGWAGDLLGVERTWPHRPLRGSVLDSLVHVHPRFPASTHSSTTQAPRPRLG